jgi:hypothetical protein
MGQELDGAGRSATTSFLLDTTIALAHLIFGVLDRFVGVKIARRTEAFSPHIGRFDNRHRQAPCQKMKRKPSEHFETALFFTCVQPAERPHLVNAAGASQVVIGTTSDSDCQQHARGRSFNARADGGGQVAILGGNVGRLSKLKTKRQT